MKIGISSAVFYPLESELAIDKLLNMGFDTAEFFFNCEYEMSDIFTDKIKNKLNLYGARLVSVHPYTAFAESVCFFSEYRRRVDEYISKYSDYFKAAQKLGVKYFTFHGDRAFKGLKNDDCALSDKQCDVLNRLSDAAKDNGITLCLENVSWCKSANIKYLAEISQKVLNIGFTLDLKQARRAGVSVDKYIDVMGQKIRNIHVSDFDDEHDCLLPGEGRFDFDDLFKKLKAIGYSGDALIEVYSSNFDKESQILRSKEFLEKLIG